MIKHTALYLTNYYYIILMKRIFLIVILYVQCIVGQQKTESVLFSELYRQYTQMPVFLSEIPLESFTKSSLFYNQNQGNFRLGQQSGQQNAFGIVSEGLYKHNRFIFWGGMHLKRLYEKDKKWNLSYSDVLSEGIMPDPHYFAVSKGSAWNSQLYDFSAGVLLPVIDRYWDLTLSTDYNLKERFRTEYDPRPNIRHNHLTLHLSNGIRIANRHKIAIGGNYGYGSTLNEIKYSEQLLNSPATYEKYVRWQVGYGTPQNAQHKRTKRNHSRQGAWLGYHHQSENNYLYAYTAYEQEHNKTYQNSNEIVNESEDILGKYTLTTLSGLLSYLYKFSNERTLHISAEASNTEGYNYLAAQQGKNYQSELQKAQLTTALLALKNGLIHYDAGVAVGYSFARQKDVLSATLTEHSQLYFAPYFRKEFALSEMSVLPQLKLIYRQKIQNKLVNNNINYYKNLIDTDYASKHVRLFYDEVVYPDFRYFGTNSYEFHFGADLKKPLAEQRFVLIGISTAYVTAFREQMGSRYYLSLNLALHY